MIQTRLLRAFVARNDISFFSNEIKIRYESFYANGTEIFRGVLPLCTMPTKTEYKSLRTFQRTNRETRNDTRPRRTVKRHRGVTANFLRHSANFPDPGR